MRFEVFLSVRRGRVTARCYDGETGEHIWSSEGARTVDLALREIARAATEAQGRSAAGAMA